MITALVRAEHGVEALAVTLSALVSGVAEGLVGDAVVLSARADDDVMRVTDALGATFVRLADGEDPWRRGAALAKREWVLCLDAGDVPTDGWIRAAERFIALSPPERRAGRFPRRAGTWSGSLALAFQSLRRGIRAGDVVRRAVLLEGGRAERPARIGARIERDPVFG